MNYLIELGINLKELEEMFKINPMLEYLNDKKKMENFYENLEKLKLG